MQRRYFITLLGGAATGPLVARAQQKPMPVIGFLALALSGPNPLMNRFQAAFRQGLSETGYVDGKNVRIEYRWAEGKPERFPALAIELVALNVDVIVSAGGTLAALAAKRATSSVPIVFSGVGDPVEEGLVASLAHPGGNITGLSSFTPDLIGKRLELLKQAVPGVRLIAFLLKPDAVPERTKEAWLKEAEVAARALGVGLQVFEARGPEDFERAFADMSNAHAGALAVLTTPVFNLHHQRLVDLAAGHRLPTVFSWRYYAAAGGLMSYATDADDQARRTGTYVGKILSGAKPADLPVEQPTKFELVINLKTAKALGLTIPQALLGRADELIE
jgi:putative tryptophan/tyrosine transport system substrate-binding protein